MFASSSVLFGSTAIDAPDERRRQDPRRGGCHPETRLVEAVLAPRGCDVISATDGDRSLEVVESAKPDVMLLDVVVPQLDVYTVCRRLREREGTAGRASPETKFQSPDPRGRDRWADD
jgi:hypothetical protein